MTEARAATVLVSGDEIRHLDALYRPVPSFAEFSAGAVLPEEWKHAVPRYRRSCMRHGEAARKRASEIAIRAAALDTGAIEGLYRVTRGITMTVATRSPGWEKALHARGEDVADLFHAQLTGYEAASDLAHADLPINATWVRQLHVEVMASSDAYRVWTASGWQDQRLPKGEYKLHPNHVRLPDGTVHAYAPIALTPAEMDTLNRELRSPAFEGADPALQAAYAHYGLVAIHPFADGNGRVARALASVFLLRAFDVPLVIYHDQREEYFDALASADRGEYAPSAAFVARRAADSLKLMVREMSPSASRRRLQYRSEDAEDWFTWFMDPRTTRENDLRRALRSVPDKDWLYAETRLRGLLHDARDALLPPVYELAPGQPVPPGPSRVYTDDELRRWELLDVKERLFFDEVQWRRTRGQGELPVRYPEGATDWAR